MRLFEKPCFTSDCAELQALGLGWHAVAFVHLYLADMAHFSAVNAVYSALLPGTNPPGRACVQLPLPAGCPVSVSVVAMCGGVAVTAAAGDGGGSGGSSGSWETASDDSCPEQLAADPGVSPAATATGDQLPEAQPSAHQQAEAAAATPATGADNDAASLAAQAAETAAAAQPGRRVLHVQSISEWAPCMIGPYSQGVAAAGLVFMSGIIPLDPPTMQLVPGAAWLRAMRQQVHNWRLSTGLASVVKQPALRKFARVWMWAFQLKHGASLTLLQAVPARSWRDAWPAVRRWPLPCAPASGERFLSASRYRDDDLWRCVKGRVQASMLEAGFPCEGCTRDIAWCRD